MVYGAKPNRRAWLAILTGISFGWAMFACSDGRSGRPGPTPLRGGDASSASGDASAEAPDGGDPGPTDGTVGGDAILGLDTDFFFDASLGRDAEVQDIGPYDSGTGCGNESEVLGRVCSPQARDWVAGAQVTVAAVDCNGHTVQLTAITGPDGRFTLTQVPPGTWDVVATAGAFSRQYTVTVPPSGQVTIPTDQLCVQQDVVKVAVVTGAGDRIETMLQNLGIRFDTYDGASGWATGAAPFLSDFAQLEAYDLVFIDCAAAAHAYTVDLGPNAAAIIENLKKYVLAGGSLYASDWAVTFLALAFPTMVQPQLRTTSTVANPFQTTELVGYAPQTINAQVTDPLLAQAIGVATVPITFPDATGARSSNWGLLDLSHTPASVLVQGSAQTCATGATVCNQQTTPGPNVTAPLAVRFKLTPATERGGNVYYTAFHNIAQTGTGVADILRWIVFHL